MTDLPPLHKGDSTLATQARLRTAGIAASRSPQRPDTRTAVCPYCGRTWIANSQSADGNSGRVMGFLVAAANNHASTCSGATPEERRAIARLDMRRWAKLRRLRGGYAPQQMVSISFRSRGYGNEPIFEDYALERFGCSLAQGMPLAEPRPQGSGASAPASPVRRADAQPLAQSSSRKIRYDARTR